MDFIRANQLNIMLFMSGMCGVLAVLSCVSKVISPKRRLILMRLESAAMFLLLADWFAYTYRGVQGPTGYVMVRVSNFLIFLLPLMMIHEITLYLSDILRNDVKTDGRLRRILACEALFSAGNYEHYCRNDRLRVVLTPDEHDLMMSDRSLDIIVPEILKDLQTEKPADGSDGQITR